MSRQRPTSRDPRPAAAPAPRRTLLLGWGNPGRLDDGLGPALAATIERRALPGVTVATGYQLQIEDAAELADYDRVVFVDAERSGPEPFSARRLAPGDRGIGFSSHSVSPGALLSLARDLFAAEPEAWLVGVRGYEFDEFGEGLSPRARGNLERAADFLCRAVATDSLPPAAAAPEPQETDA